MNDWLHNLPIVWMGLLVFGLTGLVTAAIYGAVNVLSVGERARSFKAVSPGLLPPLGILFALFVAFTASQVWSDNEKANSVVDREASALRTLPSRVQCVFECRREFTLRRLLSWAAWRQRKRELQRFGQRIGDHLRRGRAMRHQRPFLRNSVRDIVVNQAAQAHFGFSRKSRRQNHDRS